MAKEKKSYDMPVVIPSEIRASLTRDEIMAIVEKAAAANQNGFMKWLRCCKER